MLRACPRSRVLVAVSVSALFAGLAVAATPAAATPASAAPAAGAVPTSVTVFLKAPDPAGLDALAQAHGLSRAQRVSALNRLVPSDATHSGVVRALRAEGFDVTSETSWSVTATGTAARAASLFGQRPTASTGASAAANIAARGPLPRVPARLAAAVSAVFPTRGGPAVFHHNTTHTLTGTDFRNADTPAHVAPSTGKNDAGMTIATVQFADFYGPVPGPANSKRAADLTSYASEHGIADPVNPGRYQAVIVNGGPSPDDDNPYYGGDGEVALDQESILSTAPSANQHAYFAPDTDAGFGAAFAQVLDDAVGNSKATLPDSHIVALSSSWGACEAYTGAKSIAALEPILKSLVAAGVTIFAASGDDGIYDCGSDGSGTGNHDADVDYPASSPSVVGVGATHLSAATSAPNTGSNWTERSWTCTNASDCTVGNQGTGGGASGSSGTKDSDKFTGFAAPAYQRVAIDAAPFKGNAKRLVPDISADGDPASGFTIYSSNPEWSDPANHQDLGGTSLASPISAAQLTNALADARHRSGVGSIHGALYSAYARTRSLAKSNPKKVFRDVTSGANGAAANRRTDPSVKAQVGYDTVSGLGGVLWSALVPYLLDTHKPSAKVTATLPKLHTKSWRQVTASWTVSHASDSSLPAATRVQIYRSSTAKPIYQASTLPSSNHRTFTGTPGATYTIKVTGTDLDGRTSATKTATVRVPIDDSRYSISRGWHRSAGSTDVAGSHLLSVTKGATAKVSRYGRTYSLIVRTGPHSGTLGVYLHGKLIKRLNLHSAKAARKTVTIYSASKRLTRAFTLKALTTNRVAVDALYVTY